MEARENMVRSQIESRGVKDPAVLAAMRKVPRHKFLPENLRCDAYSDFPLPIGDGQTISQPYIVALMTELLAPKREHKVLEIGTGSGYQAAVLAEIVSDVYTIEIVESLSLKARENLMIAGYRNIHFRCADGGGGWPEEAPFDGIIATAAARTVPQQLVEQLKIGGRMIIPIGEEFEVQTLYILEKESNGIRMEPGISVRFVPMKGV